MSASEARLVDLAGRSDASDPAHALREALTGVMRGLAAAGGGPHEIEAMRWAAPDPAAFHPSRRAIELAYREVCGGFRPRPVLTTGAGPGLIIQARAVVGPASDEPVYRSFSLRELAREYSPRGQVPDMGAVFARWTRDGAVFRQDHTALDLAYGRSPTETLDLYRPQRPGRLPVWAFIHGGYWQASTKEQHAQFATGMLQAGFAVANIEYGLAPETSLAAIVAQIHAALRFLVDEAGALGIDPDQLHLAGHSAGAHLAAMAACDTNGPPIRSALLLAGLFDLEPLGHLPVGRLLGLSDPDAIRRLSPSNLRRPTGAQIWVAVGGRESAEFKRQSDEIARAWGTPAVLTVEDANHFDLLDGLIDGALLGHARALASGS